MRTRIKKAIVVTFVAGSVFGCIVGGILGYLVGAGKIQLKGQNPCRPVECTHYDREIIGGAIVYEKPVCCNTHGHDCPTYPVLD